MIVEAEDSKGERLARLSGLCEEPIRAPFNSRASQQADMTVLCQCMTLAINTLRRWPEHKGQHQLVARTR